MKHFNIMGVHKKIQFLGGRVHEKPIYRGDCLKKRRLEQFAGLRRSLMKKRVVVFLSGG